MRILKPAHVHALQAQYQRQGTAHCPNCHAPLRVISTPQFKTNGRMSASTFSVACQVCGVCGAVEARHKPPRA